MRLALGYWPWSLLSQPEPLPERMLIACANAVVDSALKGWGSDPSSFRPEVRAAYIAVTVHAICEEYRAAATLDFAQDKRDWHGNHQIACPVLALWVKAGRLIIGMRKQAGHSGFGENGQTT